MSRHVLHMSIFILIIVPSHVGIWTPSNILFLGPIPVLIPHSILISSTILHSLQQVVSILYNGLPLYPSKLPLSMGIWTRLTRGSFGPPKFTPKRHLDWLCHFCRAHDRDRPTDHATLSVTIGYIYIVL